MTELTTHEWTALGRAVAAAVNYEGIDARCGESDDAVASRLMLARPGLDGIGIRQAVEAIIDARLAPIRALADEWEAENAKPSKSRYVRWARRSHAYALRAALDAASAPERGDR